MQLSLPFEPITLDVSAQKLNFYATLRQLFPMLQPIGIIRIINRKFRLHRNSNELSI